jgi:tRNA pseudouridine55 synthase
MIDMIQPFWKPIGWSSFDVVKKVRGSVKPSKVGHAGTLDPFAEGVLVLCIGKMTKQVESVMNKRKEYIAEIEFGKTTDTLDLEGQITEISDVNIDSVEMIRNVLKQYIGEIEQIPPMYSALKVDGKRLYKLARKGITVKRNPRKVHVYNIELISYEDNICTIKVECGRGTYVRVLAADIAKSLSTVGYLTKLVRTKVGDYDQKSSIKIENIPEWLSLIQ